MTTNKLIRLLKLLTKLKAVSELSPTILVGVDPMIVEVVQKLKIKI